MTLFLPLAEKSSWQHGLHGKCLLKQHQCLQYIQNHATASIHMKIVCESLGGLHAFCMTGPQQWKMSTVAGEITSQIVVEVSMTFLQQGMHWYNIYDEAYIRQGKMKFMYFQWLQSLALNRIRMTFSSLFIVYSGLSFFCRMSASSQKRVYVCALHAWMCIVCVHAWLCVCFCVCICIGTNVCALLAHFHVCPRVSACVCLYFDVCLDGFLDWCCVSDLGMYNTHMVIALF